MVPVCILGNEQNNAKFQFEVGALSDYDSSFFKKPNVVNVLTSIAFFLKIALISLKVEINIEIVILEVFENFSISG